MPTPAQTLLLSGAGVRRKFVADVLALAGGVASARILWLPQPGDTLTTVEDANGRIFTYESNIGARLSKLGKGWALSFDGVGNYATTPDTADLSFGDGAADTPFSIVAVINATLSAGWKSILCKDNGSDREWTFQDRSDEKLVMGLVDDSAAKFPTRLGTPTTVHSGWMVVGGTYSAATGGDTAADDITLYRNGEVEPSGATNAAGYIAMENLGAVVSLGVTQNLATDPFLGQMAMVLLTAKALSLADHAAISGLCRQFFRF